VTLCTVCHAPCSPAEAAAYRGRCENCYVNNLPTKSQQDGRLKAEIIYGDLQRKHFSGARVER